MAGRWGGDGKFRRWGGLGEDKWEGREAIRRRRQGSRAEMLRQ